MVFALLAACLTPAPDVVGDASLACSDDATLALSGSALRPVVTNALDEPALVQPILTLVQISGPEQEQDQAPSQPDRVVPAERTVWTADDAVTLDLAGFGLAPGVWDVHVQGGQGVSWIHDAVVVLPEPSVSALAPEAICYQVDETELIVYGQGFVVLGDAHPSVLLNGRELQAQGQDCAPLAGGVDGQVCTQVALTVEPGLLPLGAAGVEVVNPEGADCGSGAPGQLLVADGPAIDRVLPEAVCADVGGVVSVHGSGFYDGTVAWVDGVEVATTVVSGAELELDLEPLEPGWFDLQVGLPGGCTTTLEQAVRASGAPIAFSVEPPVVYRYLETGVQVQLADLSGDVTDAWLVTPQGDTLEVDWGWDPEAPGHIDVTVPRDLPGGTYGVEFAQDGACEGASGATFDVRAQNKIALDRMEPGFAWGLSRTAVEIHAVDPVANGKSPFVATPRAWLIGPDDAPQTYRVFGVSWRGDTVLGATVPEGLDPGQYDVMVVNPAGELGVLLRALVVTEDPPPTVTAVSPGALDKSSTELLTVLGRDFRDPSVWLECSDGGGAPQTVATTVTEWAYGELTARVPATGFNAGVCVVVVENDDGTEARFAAVSIRNPSQNLFPWTSGEPLVHARRAPALVAGRLDSVQRFVYAVGGDAGDDASPLDSVEVSQVGVYGDLGPWRVLSQPLPEPLTGAQAASVRGFVYVVAGSNGETQRNRTYRARILDPDDAPLVTGVTLRSVEVGLEAGDWAYHVAAIYPADDLVNPGGQGLASEALVLQLPALDEGELQPTLSWTPVAGASGYAVYRTDPDGQTGWVADTTAATWSDPGGLSVDTSVVPGQVGDLGAWRQLDGLDTPRDRFCMTAAADPQPDPEIVYLYAAGGRSKDGSALDSVEVLEIRIEGPTTQTTINWRTLSQTLDTPRQDCAALTVDDSHHSLVDPGEAWVLFLGGDTGSQVTGQIQAGRVAAGGDLSDWQLTDSISPGRAGFAAASANDSLYALGGKKGDPDASGVSAELLAPLPDLRNWNSLADSLIDPRYLVGSAQESAVIFVAGGETDSEVATDTTEWTNY
jgi:hypothetical protein